MPTGYTDKIAEGISFAQFALNCAKAFGACFSIRDEPSDAPIPDAFKPSDYSEKRLKSAQDQLVKVRAMKPSECARLAMAEYEQKMAYHGQKILEQRNLRKKYNDMLVRVNAWEPPTKEHEGLKNFMRSQIEQSVSADCDGDYHETCLDKLRLLSADEWRKKEIIRLLGDVAHHANSQAKENKRAEENTLWVKQLRESLK